MSKKKKEKKKDKSFGGCPTNYRPEYCEMLVEHMAKGYSFESFAGVVNVVFKTLYNWEKEHPEFLQAKQRAKAKCLMKWESIGIDNIISMPGISLNPTVYRMNMINRFGWKDKAEDDKKIQIGLENLSDDELDKKIKELEGKDE
jgi:hypothetical protein